MSRIVFRGLYAAFPVVGLTAGDLAYATDLLVLFEWSGTAWIAYRDFPDYQGDKSGLYPQSEWGAVTDLDMSLSGSHVQVVFVYETILTYTVPAGRTLYILTTSISGVNISWGRILRGAVVIWENYFGVDKICREQWAVPQKFIAGEILTMQGQTVIGTTTYANAAGWEE